MEGGPPEQMPVAVFHDFVGKRSDPPPPARVASCRFWANTTAQRADAGPLRVVSLFPRVPQSLSKGHWVLMLFRLSFWRGFLQPHPLEQKARSEWVQGASVVGTHFRWSSASTPAESGPERSERATTYNLTQTTGCSSSSWNTVPFMSLQNFSFFLRDEKLVCCVCALWPMPQHRTHVFHGDWYTAWRQRTHTGSPPR